MSLTYAYTRNGTQIFSVTFDNSVTSGFTGTVDASAVQNVSDWNTGANITYQAKEYSFTFNSGAIKGFNRHDQYRTTNNGPDDLPVDFSITDIYYSSTAFDPSSVYPKDPNMAGKTAYAYQALSGDGDIYSGSVDPTPGAFVQI